MHARSWALGVIAIAATAWAVCPAVGEITSIRGSVTAELWELGASQPDRQAQAGESYPETSDTLPLQARVRLIAVDEEAAGSLAVQFADPRTVVGPNPQDFALNLALSSISPDVSYRARGIMQEIRGVRFSPGELGPEPVGATVALEGQLFLDGVLAVFAGEDVTDLTGVSLTLRVTIVKEVEGAADQTVFAGALQVTGGEDRQVDATASGHFPTGAVVTTDLSAIDEELSVFRVFVLPFLTIAYAYDAPVGEPFSLRATVEVEAANIPGNVGVSAILGTPIDTLEDVISLTLGEASAGKMITALEEERAAPTGDPAFAEEVGQPPLWPLSSLCGLFGVETAAGMLALVGLRRVGTWRGSAGRR